MKKTPWIISDRKLRFGIVGCGRISESHFSAIQNNEDSAELVAVCDSNQELVSKIAKKRGILPYLNLKDLLKNSDIDIVTLCTPSGLHASQAIQCAEAGKHVITEKPMATKWEDGKQMVSTCDQKGVRLFVVKQNRCNPTLKLLKKAIESKRFGRIYMVTINVFWNRPQSYYDQAPWRGTWEFDGGAFMNQASHYVDLLEWLIGPIESLQAYTSTLARNIEVEDTGTVCIKWRSGALGSLNVTTLTYPENFEGSITVLGESGTVRLGGVAVNEIQHWQFKEPSPDDDLVKTANYQVNSVYGHGHTHYYENALASIKGERETDTDGREGLKSLETLVATYLSARDGKRVSLPLDY